MSKQKKQLILLELNEINFDIVDRYIVGNPCRFPSLRKLFDLHKIRTSSEQNYIELEPWIQWPSVHTGQNFAQHGVFRLGDIVYSKVNQIFEVIEHAGYKVGVISAMNAVNRLSNPSYFIPDPWTHTPCDGSFWSRSLSEAVSQAVNDNARGSISGKSLLQLLISFARFAKIKHYYLYLTLIASSRKRPWNKAIVLDLLLHDVHSTLLSSKKPNFSTLFLNAGAHIQHHYLFNALPLRNEIASKNPDWYASPLCDPLADVLNLYDVIIGEYLDRPDTELLVATGLAQRPYDRLKFYYRLDHHADFLNSLGIKFTAVHPRMTRDFLIEFNSEHLAAAAYTTLSSLKVEGEGLPLFGDIDNRGRTLFVTLTYPYEITENTKYVIDSQSFLLKPRVIFVAIKNGMHQSEGFAFFSKNLTPFAPSDKEHVSKLGKTIASYFGVII